MAAKKQSATIDVVAKEITDDPSVAELQSIVTIDKTTEVAKFDPIKARAAELVQEIQSTVYDIATTDGEDTAKALRRRCVGMRTSAGAVYQAWNRPVLDAQTEMRAIVASIVKLVEPVEQELDAAIKAKEKIREDARLAKLAAEQARIAALRAKITSIAGFPAAAAKAGSSSEIAALLATLDACTLDEVNYAEFVDEATALHGEIRTQVADMLGAAQAREEYAAELVKQAHKLEVERQAQEVSTKRAAALLVIRSYPLSVMGMNSMQIEDYRSTLQEPTEKDFGEMLPEAKSAFASSLGQVAAILSGVQATEKAAEDLRAANVAADQRRLDDEAAAEQRQLAATASAVILKNQQDAFAEEQRVAVEQQRVAADLLAQQRRDLELKEAAMLEAEKPAPKAETVPPVVVEAAVEAAPVTRVEVVERVATDQQKAAAILVAIRSHGESELDALDRLFEVGTQHALKQMHNQLTEDEFAEIPF